MLSFTENNRYWLAYSLNRVFIDHSALDTGPHVVHAIHLVKTKPFRYEFTTNQ